MGWRSHKVGIGLSQTNHIKIIDYCDHRLLSQIKTLILIHSFAEKKTIEKQRWRSDMQKDERFAMIKVANILFQYSGHCI